ncbi:hybrid sensor histidine kinase/response regulator [Niveispirillum lacus]|uniref:Chemotaxis protein CheA n=1 Tax=Niveispirillum lacus TaxID=1981099 RepID=A0A255YTH8_9PROT|nr:chemotaxis protein CheW [Niveispirillum lacus]OYQ32523.1 hybrid sensor histidine kinase/response regulator [Niveispirillum lacus]
MDDLLSEFLTETNENLAVLDVELVKLEQNPNDPGLLSNIFRLVHTIKGTCGFLGLPRLESVAHAAENVLGKFRDGELHVSPYAVSLILESLDTIKGILSVLEATEAEPPGGDQDLIDRLNAMAEGKELPKVAAPAPVAAEPTPPANDPDELFTPVPAHLTHTLAPVAPPPPPPPTPAPVAKAEPPAPVAEVAPPPPPPPPPPRAEPQDDVRGESKESALAQQTIRVHVDLLENLMTMVSELVLTRNQLLQILRSQKDSEFAAPLQRLNHVTSELQEGVMKTRMQPIGNAWAKLPRLVRDLSHELHKKIELQMLGAETELDRQVLELIKDPLTHMVRNSGDHGLEVPADRLAAGKSETGRITLNAYHEGGHIIIEIADDGRGLALSKIKAKIVQNGLATESELAQMSDQQIQQFIFKPGFSTAAKVTSVSGRGVGMDVVKTNIEKIGGTIEMRSIEGRGTTFTIKIPLTLAIVSALIVECASERFAVPQISVIELVRAASDSEHKIERINGAPVLRLRNRLLPLVSLQNLLKLGKAEDDDKRETFIVVSQVGNYTFGIIVDRVFDTEEIVVKPVAPILRHIELFSGNTILGDGSVIMILDPNGIATASGSMGGTADNAAAGSQEVAKSARREDDKLALLLFSAGEGGPKAVPLSLVARLEDIDLNQVELSNGEPVVQYRGKLMPLVPIDPNWKIVRDKRQPVVVFADGDRSMGLVVDEIVDIVEDRLQVELGTERQGFLGSAIIANKATDVIDAGFYLTRAFKDWFGNNHESFEDDRQHRVLLVDDSPFFRNLLTPLLTVSGYDVTAVESADEALALCESGEDFDVIVSDIEMPGMSGLDFAQAVRSSARWSGTPMVALSSHAAPRDLERGRQAGFNDYVAKFDREALLFTLQQTITEKGAA